MRPVLCDVCGNMERTSYAGATISYSYPRINGLFYPEDLCDRCTVILIDTLTQARREEVDRQEKEVKKKQEEKGKQALEPREPTEDDNNPATQ